MESADTIIITTETILIVRRRDRSSPFMALLISVEIIVTMVVHGLDRYHYEALCLV